MTTYLYRQVYDKLRGRISDGTYPVGAKLPNERDLTAEFGVSAITIKRALDMLREDRLVLRRPGVGTVVLDSSGSHGNPAASGLIGCVVTSFDDTYGTRVLQGIVDAADTESLVLKRSAGVPEREEQHLAELIELGVSGIILQPTSSDFIPPTVLHLVAEGTPVVIVDRAFDEVPISSVTSDNVRGAIDATTYLFERGHSRVAFVGTSSRVSTMRDRRRGFIAAHAAHHVKLREEDIFLRVEATIPSATRSVDEDIEALRGFVAERPDVTAFVVAEYGEAVMLLEACRLEGRKVPDDASIVCFDPRARFGQSCASHRRPWCRRWPG